MWELSAQGRIFEKRDNAHRTPWTMRVHRKMHLTRPFLCSVRDCRRCFNTEEDLNEHRKLHQVDGFQCDHCYKKFSCQWRRTRHVSKIHQNLMKSLTIGFGLFYMTGVIQQRQKRRQMLTCLTRPRMWLPHSPLSDRENGNSCGLKASRSSSFQEATSVSWLQKKFCLSLSSAQTWENL